MKNTFPHEVHINGSWVPHHQAQVSVFDRGLLFGDGIYEVIPVYANKPFTLDEHLSRMGEGLEAIGIMFDTTELVNVVLQAISRARFQAGEGAVYIQITRGVAPRTHRFPAHSEPTVIAYAFPYAFGGFTEKTADVIVTPDERWHKCHVKSVSLMANVLANQQAHQAGADENVMARDGYMTEGSHTNIFFVKKETVYTHPKGPHILAGITRQLVLDLCAAEGIPVREEAVKLSELPEVDEAFLTGTTTQLLAIGRIIHGENPQRFRSLAAGAVTKHLQKAFKYRVRQFIEG